MYNKTHYIKMMDVLCIIKIYVIMRVDVRVILRVILHVYIKKINIFNKRIWALWAPGALGP